MNIVVLIGKWSWNSSRHHVEIIFDVARNSQSFWKTLFIPSRIIFWEFTYLISISRIDFKILVSKFFCFFLAMTNKSGALNIESSRKMQSMSFFLRKPCKKHSSDVTDGGNQAMFDYYIKREGKQNRYQILRINLVMLASHFQVYWFGMQDSARFIKNGTEVTRQCLIFIFRTLVLSWKLYSFNFIFLSFQKIPRPQGVR